MLHVDRFSRSDTMQYIRIIEIPTADGFSASPEKSALIESEASPQQHLARSTSSIRRRGELCLAELSSHKSICSAEATSHVVSPSRELRVTLTLTD